jgi:glycosyltransferase involved in cell wall biosynthesis
MATVSILITAFDNARHVEQSVKSALMQEATEIIVYDDASTDSTLTVLEQFGNKIRVLRGSSNMGVNKRRKALLEVATGDWIQYLDGDDFLLPGKVENQLKFVEGNSKISYCNFSIDRTIQNQIDPELFPNALEASNVLHPKDGLISWDRLPQVSCLLFPRDLLCQYEWDMPQYPLMATLKILLEMLKDGQEFVAAPFSGFTYRANWSPNQLSQRTRQRTEVKEKLYGEVSEWVREVDGDKWEEIISLNLRRIQAEKAMLGLADFPEGHFAHDQPG